MSSTHLHSNAVLQQIRHHTRRLQRKPARGHTRRSSHHNP